MARMQAGSQDEGRMIEALRDGIGQHGAVWLALGE